MSLTRTTPAGAAPSVPQVVRTPAPPSTARTRHRAGSERSRWLVPVLVVGLALVATVCAVTFLGFLAARFG